MDDHSRKGAELPCFSLQAAGGPSILWLPVAPACNMRCAGCPRRSDSVSDQAVKGVSLTPDDAVGKVAAAVVGGATPAGVVVWGPGEALANAPTFVVLKKLSWLYPDVSVTVATNGLLLSDRLEELVRSGAGNIVLSVNAASVGTAERLHQWAIYRGRKYTGEDAARLVLRQQWNGLENAVEAGLPVTVAVAEIAGVNEHEVAEIKQRAEDVGAARVVVHPFPYEA
ncbi:MAG: radical SAM protein [Nitrospirota bacterium]